MSEETKPKLKTPGPFWLWLVISLGFAQLVKRGIIGWPLPKEFNFGGRLLENLISNLIFALPILLIFGVITLILNSKNKD